MTKKIIFVAADKDYPTTLKACEVLRPNYTLITSVDPIEAITALRGLDSVDLLITDYLLKANKVFDRRWGEEMITEVHKYKPTMPAIYVPSGMMSSEFRRQDLNKIIGRMRDIGVRVGYVGKPIKQDELEAKVREMIGE